MVGTLFGVISSFSLAYYSIQIKKVLPLVNNQIWLLSYFNNVYATILFIPLLAFEAKELSNYSKLTEYKFLVLMIIGGVCGLSIGYVTVLQVQVSTFYGLWLSYIITIFKINKQKYLYVLCELYVFMFTCMRENQDFLFVVTNRINNKQYVQNIINNTCRICCKKKKIVI